MITIRRNILFFVACIFISAWLLIAQVLGETILLLPCLVCFFVLACYAAIRGMAIPIFLYFLPFSTLLKLQPGTISLYTIALLAVYLIFFFTNGRNFVIHHFFPGIALLALTLTVKTLYGYDLTNSYVMFFASLLLIPYVGRELNKNYDFYLLTLFFALGIVFSAISSQYLSVFPTIRRYIEIDDIVGIVRYSGYYGDPNFYSAHVTAALGGVLVLFLNGGSKIRTVFSAILTVLLVYCGFLSVSKSFVLVSLCIVLFWGIDFMARKGKLSSKLITAFACVVGVIFLLSSTVFVNNVDMIIERFSVNNTLSDLTTGRTDIWNNYFNEFDEDPLLLFFGKGFTKILVNDKSTHNTILQSVYQFGIVGTVFLIGWMVFYIRLLMEKAKIKRKTFIQVCILLLGAFGPWMALDLLFFEEFFLIPIYVCAGIRFLDREVAEI